MSQLVRIKRVGPDVLRGATVDELRSVARGEIIMVPLEEARELLARPIMGWMLPVGDKLPDDEADAPVEDEPDNLAAVTVEEDSAQS